MKEVSIIGVDLAKQVFQLHGATVEGEVVFRKKLSRKQFPAFMQMQPGCGVAMEACATAHHWARTLATIGHEVRLIAPKFVKPYVKSQKNDMADAEAIAEAGSRPTMRFVEVKTPEQQGLGMIFRLRDLLVGQRTQMINALRGHLAEFGLVTGKGRENVDKLPLHSESPPRVRCQRTDGPAQPNHPVATCPIRPRSSRPSAKAVKSGVRRWIFAALRTTEIRRREPAREIPRNSYSSP